MTQRGEGPEAEPILSVGTPADVGSLVSGSSLSMAGSLPPAQRAPSSLGRDRGYGYYGGGGIPGRARSGSTANRPGSLGPGSLASEETPIIDDTPVRRPQDRPAHRDSPVKRSTGPSPFEDFRLKENTKKDVFDFGNSKRFTESALRFFFSTDSENEEDKPNSPFAALNRQTSAGSYSKRSGPYSFSRTGFDSRSFAGASFGAGEPALSGFSFGGISPTSAFKVPTQPKILAKARRFLIVVAMLQLGVVGWAVIDAIPRLGGSWISLPLVFVLFFAAKKSAQVLEENCYSHHGHLVATSYVDLSEAASGVGLRALANILVALFWIFCAMALNSLIVELLYSAFPCIIFGDLSKVPVTERGEGFTDVRWYYGLVGLVQLILSLIGLGFQKNVLRVWNAYTFQISTAFWSVFALVLSLVVAVSAKIAPMVADTVLAPGQTPVDFFTNSLPKSLMVIAWCVVGVILAPRLGTAHPFFTRQHAALPVQSQRGGGDRGSFSKALTYMGLGIVAFGVALVGISCALLGNGVPVFILLLNFHCTEAASPTLPTSTPATSSPLKPVSPSIQMLLASVNLIFAAHLVIHLHRCCTELALWVWQPPAELKPTSKWLRPGSRDDSGYTYLTTPKPVRRRGLCERIRRSIAETCSCCCCCCDRDAELDQLARSGRRPCLKRVGPIFVSRIILPLAWFVAIGVSSYFFVCGTNTTCGTSVNLGIFDASYMTKWTIDLLTIGAGISCVPLVFGLPAIFDYCFQKLRKEAEEGCGGLSPRSTAMVSTNEARLVSITHPGDSDTHHALQFGSTNDEDLQLRKSGGKRPRGATPPPSAAAVARHAILGVLYRVLCVIITLLGFIGVGRVVADLVTR
jgi:hypothetical protein